MVFFERTEVTPTISKFIQDDYGALADQPLDFDDFARFKIEKTEFEEEWTTSYKK